MINPGFRPAQRGNSTVRPWRSQDPGHLGRPLGRSTVDLLWNIIVLIVVGAIAGFIARAVVPGKQSMSVGMTIVLGIIGSFVGNLLGSLLFDGEFRLGPSGIIGSIIGAIVVLLVYVFATRGRSHRTHV